MLLTQLYAHRNSWEQQRKLCKNLLIAGKRACILQWIGSVTFVNSNYLCQRVPNLSILVEKTKKNSGIVLIIIQEQSFKETRQEHVSTLSLFFTNKQQGDRNHSCVNQCKTIIKPPMSIQLNATQNEKKNTLILNSLTSFIHPVKNRKEKKKHNQTLLTQTHHVLTQDICY